MPDLADKNDQSSWADAVVHNTVKGAFAGAVEVGVSGQILWALKARLQAGEPFTFNPFVLYRGMLPHLLGRIPITAAQVGGAEVTMKILASEKHEVTLADRALGSAVGGSAAALFNAPSETVMMEQQKRATRLLDTDACQTQQPSPFRVTRDLVRNHGSQVLMTGFVGSAIRLTTYNGVIFCGIPVMGVWIKENSHLPESASKLTASAFTALLAVFISNPADLAKTVQQANIDSQKMNLRQALRYEYGHSGLRGLWKGFWWRYARVALGAVVIDKANKLFDNSSMHF
ncbi:MAG: hypothetical protein K0U29_01215 [Gammaproteobacteria bacterium]|nr:hypothetical protein [Gammaproteobacteria bacterium]MCH9743526.1 hypothetical protein [Gammaproteobacteria bacterium]